jgi:GNAT superfamily N-acetyltransferase
VRIVPFTPDLDVSDFTCGGEPHHVDLDEFLKTEALRYAGQSLGHTYVAIEGGLVLGYITHLTDSIRLSVGEKDDLKSRLGFPPPHTIPALKIGRLARVARSEGRGVGRVLMGHAFHKLMDLSDSTGCRFLSVDAIPSAVSFYEKLGFVGNEHGTAIRPACGSMRLPRNCRSGRAWVARRAADTLLEQGG